MLGEMENSHSISNLGSANAVSSSRETNNEVQNEKYLTNSHKFLIWN